MNVANLPFLRHNRVAAAIADRSPHSTVPAGTHTAVQQELKTLRYRECDAQSRFWPSRLLSCILVETDLLRVVFLGTVRSV
jgi:hypothetical protein